MTNTVTHRSTNGRWGVQVVLPEGVEDLSTPFRGRVQSLGRAGGLNCFAVQPPTPESEQHPLRPEPETYVLMGDDLSPVEGCVVVHREDLQSNDYCTILLLQPGAIWRNYGYKRRRCTIYMLAQDGSVVTPPPAVLLAAGLMQPTTDSVIEVPAVPPLPSSLAEAMRRAGLLGS